MNEFAILFEIAGHYVVRERGTLMVCRPRATHAITDCAFPDTADGMSLAKARVVYLAQRAEACHTTSREKLSGVPR